MAVAAVAAVAVVAAVAAVAAVAGEVRIASTYTQCLCVHVCLWDDL